MNGKTWDKEQPMIIEENVITQNGKMEPLTTSHEEQPEQSAEKSSYPKRSSVVELWRKREGAIKASNAISNERRRVSDYEEKKETVSELYVDSQQDVRQQERTHNVVGHRTSAERNGPEPNMSSMPEKNRNESIVSNTYAPKRSNIRDSWKKKAASIPSPQSSSNVGKSFEANSLSVDSMPTAESTRSEENKSAFSPAEKSHTSSNTGFTSNAPDASPSAFDELKSKWAKFGVQKDSIASNKPSPQKLNLESSSPEVHKGKSFDGAEDKAAVRLSPRRNYRRSKISQMDQPSTSGQIAGEAPTSRDTQESSAPKSPVSKVDSPSSETMSTFLSSRRFRSKYGRKPNLASKNGPIEKVSDLRKKDSSECVEQDFSPTSSLKNQSLSLPSIDKELVPSFSLDEAAKNNKEKKINSPSRSSLSSRASQRLRDIREKSRTDATGAPLGTKVTRTIAPQDVVTDSINEPDFQDPGVIPFRPSRSSRQNQIRSNDNAFAPMDESVGLSPGERLTKQDRESQMYSTTAFTTNSDSVAESKNRENFVLHHHIDAKGMVPDKFVAENNSNLESFKTAYDSTTFGQIAKDMTAEASAVLNSEILSYGMNAAMNTLGELFQIPSPRKSSKRAPSPVEEVAIEVEYVADDD